MYLYKFLNYKNNKKEENILNKFKIIYLDLIYEFKKYKFTLKPPTKLKYDWNILNWLKQNGKLNSETGFLQWMSSSGIFKRELKQNLIDNYSTIQQICEKSFLNFDIIKLYFDNLLELIIALITINKDIDKNYDDSIFDWTKNIKNSLNSVIVENSIEEKINFTFLLTNPENIALRLDINDDNFTTIKYQRNVNLENKYGNYNTLCMNVSNYLFYYELSNFNNNYNIKIISNVKLSELPKIFPFLYNEAYIKNVYITSKNVYYFNGNLWENFIYEIKNNKTFNYFPLYNKKELSVLYKFIKQEERLKNILEYS